LNLPLKNPADLAERLELVEPERVLLIDPPPELASLVEGARAAPRTTRLSSGDALRTVKESFDVILVWREDRGGSRSIFERAVKRLDRGGAIWVVTALRKVRGPTTPAVHRLELSDLVKAFAKEGLAHDREVRVSAWNVAYRFRKKSGAELTYST
jgi:predicted O-methyltransferase YrrM